jgi:hypothetical protein
MEGEMMEDDTTLEHGDASPRSYEDIQRLSGKTGRPARKLIALSVTSDPFYAGLPYRRAWAAWFAGLWDRFHFPKGYHLRRIHYRIVSDPSPPLMPVNRGKTSGSPYLNTEECWRKLQLGARDARHLGLVAADAFADHRNPDPVIHAPTEQSSDEPRCEVGELPPWSGPSVALAEGALGCCDVPQMPSVTIAGYDYKPGDQPYHLELWIEKTTMADVLEPICGDLHVNLVAAAGFQTITASVELLKRLERLPPDKPVRIGYLSDFDPAGIRMAPAVARVVEFYRNQFAPDCDLKLTSLALTKAQVDAFELPRIPVKETDRRGPAFERQHGEGQVELDALEAIHPGELERIVREFFGSYHDPSLEERLTEVRDQAEEEAREEWDEATADRRRGLEVTLAKIRRIVGAVRPEAERLNGRLQAALAPLLAKVERLRHVLSEASVTPELPERPEPETEGQDESTWLYASERAYLEQLGHYPPQNFPRNPYVKKQKPTVPCEQCKTPFVQKRSDARFCSQVCRTAFCRAQARAERAGP